MDELPTYLKAALVEQLENDPDAEQVLRIALPYIERAREIPSDDAPAEMAYVAFMTEEHLRRRLCKPWADLDEEAKQTWRDVALAVISGTERSGIWGRIAARALKRARNVEEENYAIKLAAAGGEDAPGSAQAVTAADVEKWRKADERHRRDLEGALRVAKDLIENLYGHEGAEGFSESTEALNEAWKAAHMAATGVEP